MNDVVKTIIPSGNGERGAMGAIAPNMMSFLVVFMTVFSMGI